MSRERHSNQEWRAPILLLFVIVTGCNDTNCPGLDATLWHQHSEEYKTLCKNLYAHAGLRLEEAQRTPTWSADVYQMSADSLPSETAVILDIDETVLNNAPLFARVLKNGETDMGKAWAIWASEASAAPIDGAAPFVRKALDSGINVFFVSNRSCTFDAATQKNLKNAKIPVDHPRVHFLSRNTGFKNLAEVERCPELEKTVVRLFNRENVKFYAYKGERRALIASKFRVLMLLGDSQGDFYSLPPPPDASTAERERLLKAQLTPTERESINHRYGKYFHDRWIQLPNAMYGNWLSSRTGYGSSSMREKVRKRLSLLSLN